MGISIHTDASYRSLSNDEEPLPAPVRPSRARSGSQQEIPPPRDDRVESAGLLHRTGSGDSPWPGIWRLVGEVDSLEPDKLLLSSLRDLMGAVKGTSR